MASIIGYDNLAHTSRINLCVAPTELRSAHANNYYKGGGGGGGVAEPNKMQQHGGRFKNGKT